MKLCHANTDKVSFVERPAKAHLTVVITPLWRAAMAYIAHHPVTNSQLWSVVPRLGARLRLWRRTSRERAGWSGPGGRCVDPPRLSRGTVFANWQKPFWRE